jgi:hypothetical protein
MSQTLEPALGEATVQELREAVRGQVLTPGEDGYAEARPIWNGMHEGRRPGLIVRYFEKKLGTRTSRAASGTSATAASPSTRSGNRPSASERSFDVK